MNHISKLVLGLLAAFVAVEASYSFNEKTGSKMDLGLATSFLAVHNDIRRDVALGRIEGQPEAADMSELKWDKELATKAQKWADKCQIGHDTYDMRRTEKFPYVGQNWAGMNRVNKAVVRWFNEQLNYDFSSSSCAKEPCGHYTQMIWSWITHVGCAVADCSHKHGFRYGRVIVCDYGPGGNMKDVQPYIEGEACSMCLPDQPYCNKGLCTDEASHH
ncbi:hypothetical protein Ciccas_003490 [Cichlidogyrus casuarinus]|uniref:SCP domain-containing protein n=1 Tax=Cichlidogyrus casuarinus TaxID=1844966 RepID=A0ABD2QEA0_9PLAT